MQDPPLFSPEQEFRYALVLYGGVSLAVYINGVVQEFFRLVRSTAPVWPLSTDVDQQCAWFPLAPGGRGDVEPLRGSERVYRRLGQLLPRRMGSDADAPIDTDAPIRTRFVVDILSGSSAGGINGIFLAKALANQQSIDELRNLWVDEGDIGILLNDARSYRDLGSPRKLRPQRPPRSLLNGYRLFVRALQSLQAMNGTEQKPESTLSPSYAEQVDLAVTATDLQGLRLPIKLFDGVVHEAKHKHVFRFAYWTKEATGTARNDFVPANDPLLAFAARCTSSFPFAFEPMVLDDLVDVLTSSEYPPPDGLWPQFFGDYKRADAEYWKYAFADGGYLDNKPFSYATEQLTRRRADVPVERRLIYIEPDPPVALPADATAEDPKERPDVFANITAAAMGLPRAETIREDIDAVIRRSRTIRRIREVTGTFVDELENGTVPGESTDANVAYWALRRRIVLDDLAEVVGRVVGIVEDSDAQYALQLCVASWADAREISDLELARDFDLGFRLRRLVFVCRRIDGMLNAARVGAAGAATAEQAELLRRAKLALNEVFVELRWRGRGARVPARTAALIEESEDTRADPAAAAGDAQRFRDVADAIASFGMTAPELVGAVLDAGDGSVRSYDAARVKAATLAADRVGDLNAVAATLQAVFALPFAAEEAAARLVLGGDPGDPAAVTEANRWLLLAREGNEGVPNVLVGLEGLGQFRERLRSYYEAFERVDAVLLPLTYPDLEEVNPVEVVRISPQDATSLIQEPMQGKSGRRKLAGTSVHHFGGFLDRRFRVNDILWGRLDGAERIIKTTLRPDHPEADKLVAAAQLAIIDEDLLGETREPWVTAQLGKAGTVAPPPGASKNDLGDLLGWQPDRLDAALAIRHYLATDFEVNRQPDRRKMLDVVGRSTTISNDVIGAAADSLTSLRSPMTWIGRFGRLITGLAALATQPREGHLARLVFRNIALMALLVGIVLIVLGILGVEGTSRAGWIVLAVTAVAQIAVWAATAWVGAPSRTPGERRSRLWRWLIRTAIAIIVIALLWATIRGLSDAIDWLNDNDRPWN